MKKKLCLVLRWLSSERKRIFLGDHKTFHLAIEKALLSITSLFVKPSWICRDVFCSPFQIQIVAAYFLTDRFSISCKRWEPPFMGFCRNLVPCGLLGSYLGVKNIFSLSLLIWAWGHTLYFSLQCKTNPMIVIADFFQTQVIFII